MSQLAHFGLSSLLCFAVTALAILALRPLAIAIDLVDHPGGRKMHEGAVPLVGGLGIFLGLSVALGIDHAWLPAAPGLLAVCALMVVVGLFDDRFALSPTSRLAAQVIAVLVLLGTTHVQLPTLGDPFALGALALPAWGAVAFSLAMAIGAINAFNMLDGMDGQAGASALVSLAGLAALAWGVPGGEDEVLTCLLLGSAVLAFLAFNAPFGFNRRMRCFMGDAGSTMLGMAIAWLCLSIGGMPRGDGQAHPVYVLWMVALPVVELWSTFLRRLAKGHSPFRPDADHIHHHLLRAGLGPRRALAVHVALALFLMALGLAMEHAGLPDWFALGALVLCGVLISVGLPGLAALVAARRPAGAAAKPPMAS